MYYLGGAGKATKKDVDYSTAKKLDTNQNRIRIIEIST